MQIGMPRLVRRFWMVLLALSVVLCGSLGMRPHLLLAQRLPAPGGAARAIAPAAGSYSRGVGERARAAVTAPARPWFHLQPEVLARWTLVADPADPLRFTLAPRQQPASGRPKQVLLLFAIPSSLFDTTLTVLCDTFLSDRIPVVFTLILFHSTPALGRAALQYAVQRHMDLIFSMGSATTAFVHASFRNGPVPVVTIMSKDPVLLGQMPDYQMGSGTNIAYTSVNVPIQVQMAYLRTLDPGLKAIGVLYGLDDPSARQTQVVPLKQAAMPLHVAVVDITVRGVQTAHSDLLSAMPRALAALRRIDPSLRHTVLLVTGSTSIVNEMHTVNQLSGQIPVLSVFPELVRDGADSAVLSIGVSFSAASQLASLYGIDILRGKAQAGRLKVGTVSPPDIAINFQRAREVGLKIPFSFFESAGFVYNDAGVLVRSNGENVR